MALSTDVFLHVSLFQPLSESISPFVLMHFMETQKKKRKENYNFLQMPKTNPLETAVCRASVLVAVGVKAQYRSCGNSTMVNSISSERGHQERLLKLERKQQ